MGVTVSMFVSVAMGGVREFGIWGDLLRPLTYMYMYMYSVCLVKVGCLCVLYSVQNEVRPHHAVCIGPAMATVFALCPAECSWADSAWLYSHLCTCYMYMYMYTCMTIVFIQYLSSCAKFC